MSDSLRKAHEMSKMTPDQMIKALANYPEIRKEIEENLKKYGVPFLSAAMGARWKEDLHQDVYQLLNRTYAHHPIEIRIYPEDPDCHHWAVEYSLLEWDEEKGAYRKSGEKK